MTAGHGPNIGHGYVKYVVIEHDGAERCVVFPAQIARAATRTEGALKTAATVKAGGERWWVGDDAQLAATPLTMLSQDRLHHAAFIPALMTAALSRFGTLNGATSGRCVTGLPATWARDAEKCRALGMRLREAHPFEKILVIAEPLGLAYSVVLDASGRTVGDPALTEGHLGVLDIGHLTVDTAELRRLAVVKDSDDTWQLGTATALRAVRAQLAAATERELSLTEVDQAVRAGSIRLAGKDRPLPAGWDRPLLEKAQELVSRCRERWGSGATLDAILIGGGGAEERRLVEPILAHYPHATVVDQPQTAIARGYARLARRLGGAR
jgi:hypothetical protein